MKPAIKTILTARVPSTLFVLTCLLLTTVLLTAKVMTDRVITVVGYTEEVVAMPPLPLGPSASDLAATPQVNR